jgi:hypothetical protein
MFSSGRPLAFRLSPKGSPARFARFPFGWPAAGGIFHKVFPKGKSGFHFSRFFAIIGVWKFIEKEVF